MFQSAPSCRVVLFFCRSRALVLQLGTDFTHYGSDNVFARNSGLSEIGMICDMIGEKCVPKVLEGVNNSFKLETQNLKPQYLYNCKSDQV